MDVWDSPTGRQWHAAGESPWVSTAAADASAATATTAAVAAAGFTAAGYVATPGAPAQPLPVAIRSFWRWATVHLTSRHHLISANTHACTCVSVIQSSKMSKRTEKSLQFLLLLKLLGGTFCQLLQTSRPPQLTCTGRHSWSGSSPSRTHCLCLSTSASSVTSQAWSGYS